MSHKEIIILGAGGHARVLLETLRRLSIKVMGVVSPSLTKGTKQNGIMILGDDSILKNYNPNDTVLINGLGSLPGKERRWELYQKYKKSGFKFLTIVDPTAIIAGDVVLDEGAQVMAGVVIQPGVKIGENSIVNTRASIDHDCNIGAHCHIAPGVTLSGGIGVGDYAHVGTGASVIQNISIGEYAVVPAGAVIYKELVE